MLPDTVKDPVGYFVSASRPGDDGGYSKGVVKAYNEQHSTVLVRFDDGEEAWFGPDDKLTYLQQAIQPNSPKHDHAPVPSNPLQWKVRLSSGKKGLVVGYSAPLAHIAMESGESIYLNIATHDVDFLYCTSIFQFEATPQHPETDDSHDPLLTTLPLFAKQFDVTDVRTKLATYRSILEHCQSSPTWQTKLGTDLKTLENEHRRIHFVFQDLQADDRGLRLAAARCICALAYENEANQAMMNTENGLTVDWLRVFSIPSKFQQLYDDDCRAECRIPDQEDFIQFLTKLIRNNMASVAASVYNYYDRATHLPRLWCYPRVHGSLHEWSSVPDPECHFIGYILTPRSTVHLPKHLTSADIQDIADLFTPDKSVMTLLKTAQVVHASIPHPVNRFVLYDALKAVPVLAGVLDDRPPLAGLVQSFEQATDIAWRDLFGYLTTRVHIDVLTRNWGDKFIPELLRVFTSLIPLSNPWIDHHSWVWQAQLRDALQTNAMLNAVHVFHEVLDEGEAPLRLLMALTHLRRIEVPPPPKSNPKNRRKSSKDHRVSLAIASAQQAVQALKATQAKHHTESTFQKHISDVNTITTYVSQNAQKLHDKVMQHAHTPLVLAPICTNLDDIVSSMQNTKHQSQQDREHVVLTNKERLEALEKRHQAAVEAKKQKWQQQCDAIEAAKQQKKREVHARNASKMARVHQERTALERRHDQDVRKLEQKVEKIMKSPRHSVAKLAIKPHPPPPKQTDAILPTPPATAMIPKHLTKGARPQSARVIRDRTIAFGNMVSKLHTVEVLVKKEQTKAMWRHLHSENKRFQPPAPSVAKCVDIEGETLHRTKLSFAPPAQRAITSLDLPLANEAACIKLASELIPPAVKPPDIDDDSSTSYCILAKYNRTLDEDQRQLFKARFSTNNVKLNHRLTFAVQEQYVHMARRNQAWGAFCASSRIYSDDPEQLKRTEFITVAKKLGIVLRDDAEYETVCRRLDKNLTGFLAWRDFYEWFLDQDLKHAMGGVDRRVTSSSIS
ncbi:hypothetical protein H310_11739 [Aphanomyces invadans]|uniref:EF-hand domain-containing protein n=1 Tax=Aphanomyces invadans TaxID=157072 RepID=A0A024TLA1_9STRA|nr:hypothetical protein H310_11739 [Aphanomyces invadans]ETV94784.1 hypothetical protein H310_11739 [Aphanomyces invadans]|eukprot:XP_008876729.1 hypothetical protein H310_11739 [Aphanomyces invadans]